MMARSMKDGPFGIGASSSRLPRNSYLLSFERDRQERKLIQYRIMSMLHDRLCKKQDFKKTCKTMKTLLNHMTTCYLQKCATPHCTSSRYILTHWKNCAKLDCSECFPLTEMNKIRNNPFHEETPLHLAVSDSNLIWAQVLIITGTCVNDKSKFEQTPLHLSAINGNFEFSKMLIENGADVNERDNRGETPLHIVTMNGNIKFTRMLLENGADINAKTNLSETPLHLICNYKNLKMLRLALDNGANVNVANYCDETPLHRSCSEYNLEFTRLLIENGADVNAIDSDGRTPIHYILNEHRGNSSIELVSMMLCYNACVNEVDKLGEFPFMMAVREWNHEMADILFDFVDELNYKSVFLYTISMIFLHNLIDSIPERVFEYIDKIKISEASRELIDDDINCAELTNTSIYTCFHEKSVSLKWVWFLLSKEFPVTFRDVEIFYEMKGFCEEIEAILTSEVRIDYEYGYGDPFVKMLVFNKKNYNDVIVNNFYFVGDECVPSLMQLARDSCRKSIFDEHQRGVNFKAYNFIKRMNVPKIFKDILLLRRPIYEIDEST